MKRSSVLGLILALAGSPALAAATHAAPHYSTSPQASAPRAAAPRFTSPTAPHNSSLSVNVVDQNDNPLQAEVIALFFSAGNPDPVATQIAFTNSGVANFSPLYGNALYDGDVYTVVATTQGETPGIAAQFNNNPTQITADPSSPRNIAITLTATASLGEIDVPISGATASSLVFGQIALQGGGGAVQYSATPTDGSGGGLLRFYDVAYAAGNTYVASASDPNSNQSQSTPVVASLSAGTPGITISPALSLNTNTAPPVTNISQSQQSGQGGTLSLSGVLTDTNTPTNAVPYSGLNFIGTYTDQYNNTKNDYRGVQTDQNGAFQLYGLLPGVTYYTTSYGGCSFNGVCYPGFSDPPTTNGTPNPPIAGQDFIGPSSGTTLPFLDIELQSAPPGNGTLAVYVTDQFGDPYPQAGISLYPDNSPWQTTPGACADGSYPNGDVSNPGLKAVNLNNVATGYALLTGLPSGNYDLQACTSNGCTSWNAPGNGPNGSSFYPDGCSNAQSQDPGAVFYRLTIDTTATPDVKFYDIYGNLIGGVPVSSATVVVNVSTATGGVITGAITFPSGPIDLSQNTILISASPNCSGGGQCPPGAGFKVLNDPLTPQTTTYSIAVSSGYAFNFQVQSSYWGAIFPGGGQPQPDLTASTSAVVNLQFSSAGRILGTMRNPDGSAYLVSSNSSGGPPQVNANGDSSGGWTQINNDGSFVIGGLLPGAYTLLAAPPGGGGSFPYTTQPPAPTVAVVAGQDARQDVDLVSAVTVAPVVSTASLPSLAQYACGNNTNNCPPEVWTVLAYPAGTPFNTPNVSSILSGSNSNANEFQFNASTGQINNGNCSGQFLSQPGFCTSPIAANPTGTAYDFYVMRMGEFDTRGLAGGARPYFVIESSSKSVTVSPQLAAGHRWNPQNNYPVGSTTTVQNVALTPVPSLSGVQQAVLAGTVTISNLINQREFQQLGGNFSNFLQYLPLIWVYNSSGALVSGGLVVPFPPNEAPLDGTLKQSVANGNFSQFQTLLTAAPPAGLGPVGYQIRGLTAGQTYSIVATTPNYPPYKGSVTLGAIGSTTTLDIDFDANAGATLTGVVVTTNSAPIAGAQVTVQSVGYPAATVTTGSSGTWSLSGLSPGQYQVQVVASGYIQAAQTVSVGASGTLAIAPTIALPLGGSSITGTVYTNNPICPAGAVCSAFGKTVLQGALVAAYDDTLNADSPTAVLPLYTAITSSAGVYTLNGLVSSDTFKVFVNDPGYYVLNQSTQTLPGALAGFDFALTPKPLSVNVFGYPSGANYEFQITNYQRFSSGSAWIGPQIDFSTGVGGNAAAVNFVQKPDSQGNPELFLDYPLSSLSSGVSYVLLIVAQPNDPSAAPVVSQTVFGQGIPNNACQSIDQSLLGNSAVNAQGVPSNQAPLDITGANASYLSLPVGGVIPSLSTAVPSMCMNQTDANVSPPAVSAIRSAALNVDAFLSGVYGVTLSSVNYIKGVTLTLSYNQATTDINDAAIFAYNQATQQWQSVPGLQTIDPVRGTISVSGLVSLASVLNVKSAAAESLMAVTTGRGFRPASGGAVVDYGQFAILRPSQVSGGAFSGTVVKVYNFPNPFNLQAKSVTLNTAAGVCQNLSGSIVTNGTVIKYEIPSGISGTGVIRIYTLSGRLVRELDAGNIQPENCYYTTWDGKNRNGLPVADGVYYGILSVAGSKLSSGTFKLAVIK